MAIATILTAMALAALAGMGAGRIWAAGHPKANSLELLPRALAKRHLTILFLVAAAGLLLSATANDAVCRHLPLLIQRYLFPITWGYFAALLAFGLSLVATLAHTTRKEDLRNALAITGLVMLVLFGQIGLRQVSATISARPRLTEDGVVLQSHPSTCGAATLANLAQYHGMSLSEADAVRLLGTTAAGTTCGQYRYALDRLGLTFEEKRDPLATLDDLAAPATLFVDHPAVGREAHCVLYAGRSERGYEILDPLKGREWWDATEARSRWHGKAVITVPQ